MGVMASLYSSDFNTRLRYVLRRWLSAGQITQICKDSFFDVFARFNSHTSKAHKINRLLRYCRDRGRIEDLVRAIKQTKESAYIQLFAPQFAAELYAIGGGPDPDPAPVNAPVSAPAIAPTPQQLLKTLTERFNLEELKTLCFELGVDHEALDGSTKQAKARELILYMSRHGRLLDLVASL